MSQIFASTLVTRFEIPRLNLKSEELLQKTLLIIQFSSGPRWKSSSEISNFPSSLCEVISFQCLISCNVINFFNFQILSTPSISCTSSWRSATTSLLFDDDFSVNFRCVLSIFNRSEFNYIIFQIFCALFNLTLRHYLFFLTYFLIDFSDFVTPRLDTAVSVI